VGRGRFSKVNSLSYNILHVIVQVGGGGVVELLQINSRQPLSHNWIVAFISCTLGGNQAYDTFISSHNPIYLGAVEAIPLIRNNLGSLDHEEELTVFFVKEGGGGARGGLVTKSR